MKCAVYQPLTVALLLCAACIYADSTFEYRRYMDDSSDCGQTQSVYSFDKYTVSARDRFPSAFAPNSCKMTFKALSSSDKLKVTFTKFSMTDCQADLFIYEARTTTSLREKLSCSSGTPATFTSSGRYLTFFLSKGVSNGYDFEFEVTKVDSDNTDFSDFADIPGKVLDLAVGVIVAIVVGVVAVIVICIVVCVCCCCRNNRKGHVQQPAATVTTTTTANTGNAAYQAVPTNAPPGAYPQGGYPPQGYPPVAAPYPPPGTAPYPPPGTAPYPPPGAYPESAQGYPPPQQAYPSAPPAYGEAGYGMEYSAANDQVKVAPPP